MYTASVTRLSVGPEEEDFDNFEVNDFEEALEKCKSVGSLGGLIDNTVNFIQIDKENMYAEFEVNGRTRYIGDIFYLRLVTK